MLYEQFLDYSFYGENVPKLGECKKRESDTQKWVCEDTSHPRFNIWRHVKGGYLECFFKYMDPNKPRAEWAFDDADADYRIKPNQGGKGVSKYE